MKSGKKSNAAKRPPARSEIGTIGFWTDVNFEIEVKDFRGRPVPQKRKGIQFYLVAVGPNGRYTASEAEPFEAKAESDRLGWYVPWSGPARDAWNKMIQKLWQEGWQPTSMGRRWHECSFRRVVPDPDEPEDTSEVPGDTVVPEVVAPGAFRKVEASYAQLRADFAAGRIKPDQYRTALKSLKVKEPAGREWMIDGQSGRWLAFDGQTWQPADPPRE